VWFWICLMNMVADSRVRNCSNLSSRHTLVVALPGALVSGFIYAYSTYSNALQAAFNLTEPEKENIGIAPSLCNFVTFTNGLILDRTSVRFCCLLSGSIILFAYGLFSAIALKIIHVGSPGTVLFLLAILGSYGSSFMVAAVFTTLTKNFVDDRSAVVSMAKAWVGVATGVATAIYVGIFPSDPADPLRLRFVLFLTLVGGLTPICISPFLRPLPAQRERKRWRFLMPRSKMLPNGFVLSTVLIATTLASTFSDSPLWSVALIAILVSPVALIITKCSSPASDGSDISVCSSVAVMDADANFMTSPTNEIRRRSFWEGGPLHMLTFPEAYMLWFCTLSLQSGGLFLSASLGSILAARDDCRVAPGTAVTIFSCFQGFARLVTGSFSNKLMHSGLPRTCSFPMMLLVMATAHAVFMLPGDIAVYVGTALCGWAFGACYPLLVLVVGEIWGEERIASNYMIFDGTPGAVGSLVFARVLPSAMVKAHADPDGVCRGDHCFFDVHAVILSCQALCFIIGCVFACRTRVVYKSLGYT